MTDIQPLVFSTEMGELKKYVNYVRNGMGSSKMDLQQMLLKFEVNGNVATIFAAEKEIFARVGKMKVTRAEENAMGGTFAVLGGKIERLISQVESEIVTFSSDGENLTVNAGFLTVNFELFDAATLKTIEQGVRDHLTMEGLTVNRSHFEEALVCGRSCTTTNSIKPDVNHVEMRNGRMFASDGRKIMVYVHQGFPATMAFKAPSSALSSLISAIKNIDAENIQIIEGKSYYYVKANSNEYTLGVRKVERTFPAVDNLIEKQDAPTDEVSIDKNVLSGMLKGVALGLPTDDVRVTLEIGGTGKEAYVEASTINTMKRRSHERATCGRKNPKENLTFPLSFKHLLDTLDVFKGDSVVDLMILLKKNLMIVRDHTETREVLTVIPFRTDKQVMEEKKEKEALAEARKKAAEPTNAETAAVQDTGADVDLEEVVEAKV